MPEWPYAHRAALLKLADADVVDLTLVEAAQVDEPSGSKPAQLAWLKVALRNNQLDAARRGKAQKRDPQRVRRLSTFAAGSQESPSRIATKREEIQRLLAFIGTLPPEQAAAVRLRHIDGLSVPEVAEKLGKTRPAAAGLLRRALAALRIALESSSQ